MDKEVIYQTLKEKLAELFKIDIEKLTPEISLKDDLCLPSIKVTTLLNALEDEFDVEIPYMKFGRCKNLEECAEFIADLLEY